MRRWAWLAGVSALLMFLVGIGVRQPWWDPLELSWLHPMVAWRSSAANVLAAFFTLLGDNAALIFLVVFLWIRCGSTCGKQALLIWSLNLVLNPLVKLIFVRPRPNLEPLMSAKLTSYPSGHAMAAACLLGYAALLAYRSGRRALAGGLLLAILAVGASRVYLGVHYATDVLGGFLTGFSLLAWVVAWKEGRNRR